ncbi:dihydropteroate synthase [Angustibacter aerolatus]
MPQPLAVPVGLGVRTVGRQTIDLDRRPLVMAIVNRTRDSFFDGGRTFALDAATAAVERAVADGADWVDVGAVPFSPDAERVDEAEELDRLLPVVAAARATGDVIVSVETTRPAVARAAFAAGADVLNDTSGLHDPELADATAEAGGTLVVCHSLARPFEHLHRPTYTDVVREVHDLLAERVAVARSRGVEHLVVDPGHDLNKTTRHSLELTRRLDELLDLGEPVLASVSRKDFVQEAVGVARDDALPATLAAVVLCVLRGARVLRVHDVAAARDAVRMTEAVLGWREPATERHNL